jgi:hypothetical protein
MGSQVMLVPFTRPDRSKVWICPQSIHLVREAFGNEDGLTVIIHYGGMQGVNESVDEVLKILMGNH